MMSSQPEKKSKSILYHEGVARIGMIIMVSRVHLNLKIENRLLFVVCLPTSCVKSLKSVTNSHDHRHPTSNGNNNNDDDGSVSILNMKPSRDTQDTFPRLLLMSSWFFIDVCDRAHNIFIFTLASS